MNTTLWQSLLPLLIVNGLALSTVLIYLFIHKPSSPSQTEVELEAELEKRHDSKLLNRWFKKYWYWVTSPVEKLALKFHLTPNFFTSLGFFICILSAIAYGYGSIAVGGWCVILGGTCDMFDGRVARLTHSSSPAGAFYDSVMDRYGELVTFVGLAILFHSHWFLWFILASIVGSVMVSYARARGEAVGVLFTGGAMQRPERIVYLGVGSIFSPIFRQIFSPFHPALDCEFLLYAAVILIAVMTNWTAVYRTFAVYKELQKKSLGV